jgi:Zn-dependent protease with chaperone function
MSVLGAIQLIMLAAAAFALLLGGVASCCARLVLSRTATWAPERRHRALLLLSVAPMALTGIGLLAVLAPSLLAIIWPAYDHCLSHGDHHVHLCLVHLPHHMGNAASCVVLVLLVAWTSARATRALVDLHGAARRASQLRLHGRGDAELDATVLPTLTPICLLAGIFKPTLFLSDGLLSAVDHEAIQVIVHHERAHAARRDILLRLVARAGTLFLWPSSRARLLAALELAAERSCDEYAAALVGDRLQVAEAILKVERLLQGAAPRLAPLSVAFGGETVPQRVTALLEAPRRSGNLALLAVAFGALSCAVLASSGPLHHWTESLLAALVH